MLRAHCQKLNLLEQTSVSCGVILYFLENLPLPCLCILMVLGAAVSRRRVRYRSPGLGRFCGSSCEDRLYDILLLCISIQNPLKYPLEPKPLLGPLLVFFRVFNNVLWTNTITQLGLLSSQA